MHISYKIDHTDVMAHDIAHFLCEETGTSFSKMNPEVAVGSLEFFRLSEKLSVQISRFSFNKETSVHRLGVASGKDLLILDFHKRGIGLLKVDDNKKAIDNISQLNHGAYFASGAVQSNAIFPPDNAYEEFHIVMDRRWLIDYFGIDAQLLGLSGDFFMYERLNRSMVLALECIFTTSLSGTLRKRLLYGKSIELITFILDALSQRESSTQYDVTNYNDVQRIFELITYVEQHLQQNLSVKELALVAGFSESKLQQLFKSILGRSVSKEITRIRMFKALELLASHRFTISEVGYKMGYSNMSHFANAFKRVHGFLPSEYIH